MFLWSVLMMMVTAASRHVSDFFSAVCVCKLSQSNSNFRWMMKRETLIFLIRFSYMSSFLHVEVLQRMKTPNTKPKKIPESGSEDR